MRPCCSQPADRATDFVLPRISEQFSGGGSQSGNHSNRPSHSEASATNQMSKSSSIAAPISKVCGIRNTPPVRFPASPEPSDVAGHRPGIMGNKVPPFSGGQRQNLWILHPSQFSRMGRQEIQTRLSAQPPVTIPY